MTEQETFNEWVKQLESSMAVPMYPKALLLDFMKKAFFAGLEQHSHDYLVKTKDLKANFDYILEGKDLEIKQLGERCNQLLKDKGDLTDKVAELEKEIAQARKIILKLYNAGRDVLMCRAEEKAYDNLSNAINDKSIEQFLNSKVEK